TRQARGWPNHLLLLCQHVANCTAAGLPKERARRPDGCAEKNPDQGHRDLELKMDKHLFAELTESLEQMGEITRGERAPSREFTVDAIKVKQVRAKTKLSQAKFADVIDVQVSTLRNWEQGRR